MTISAIMILTFSGLMASLSWISWSYYDVLLLWSRTPSPAWCMTCHRCHRRGKVFVCSDNHCRTDTSPRSWKSESKSESQMRFFKRDSFVLKIIVRETHSWAIFHNILENIACRWKDIPKLSNHQSGFPTVCISRIQNRLSFLQNQKHGLGTLWYVI